MLRPYRPHTKLDLFNDPIIQLITAVIWLTKNVAKLGVSHLVTEVPVPNAVN